MAFPTNEVSVVTVIDSLPIKPDKHVTVAEAHDHGYYPLYMPAVFKDKPGVFCGPVDVGQMYWRGTDRNIGLNNVPFNPDKGSVAMRVTDIPDGILFACGHHVHQNPRMLWCEVPIYLSVWSFFFRTREFAEALMDRDRGYVLSFHFREVYENWHEATREEDPRLLVAEAMLILKGRTGSTFRRNFPLVRACEGWFKCHSR